jgi:hypothetical protein
MVADHCGDHAASANFPAISLFTRCTVPLPTPTIAATLSMPYPALRCSRMAASILGETLGRPSFLPCWRTRSSPAENPAAYDRSFLFAEHRCHLDHRPPHWRGAVDGLLVGIEGDASSIEFRKGVGHVENTAPQSVDGPHHQDIELSSYRLLEHRVECWALIPAFRAADALILVGLDDQPATAFGHLLKEAVGCRWSGRHGSRAGRSLRGRHRCSLLKPAIVMKLQRNDTTIPKLSNYPQGNGRHVLAI